MVSAETLGAVEAAIKDLTQGSPDGRLDLQKHSDPAVSAKVHMGLAFAVNSLFYCKWPGAR